jgi:hypothetical protein
MPPAPDSAPSRPASLSPQQSALHTCPVIQATSADLDIREDSVCLPVAQSAAADWQPCQQSLFVNETGLTSRPGGRKICLLAIHVALSFSSRRNFSWTRKGAGVSDTQMSTRPQTLSARTNRVRNVQRLHKSSSRSVKIASHKNGNVDAFAGLHLSVLEGARLTPRQNEVFASAQWPRRNRNLSGQMAAPMAAPRSVRVQSVALSRP